MATKKKPKKKDAHVKAHRARKPAAKKKSSRWADVRCKGECRIRTTGMRKGIRYRRVTPDGKQIVIRVVGHE